MKRTHIKNHSLNFGISFIFILYIFGRMLVKLFHTGLKTSFKQACRTGIKQSQDQYLNIRADDIFIPVIRETYEVFNEKQIRVDSNDFSVSVPGIHDFYTGE